MVSVAARSMTHEILPWEMSSEEFHQYLQQGRKDEELIARLARKYAVRLKSGTYYATDAGNQIISADLGYYNALLEKREARARLIGPNVDGKPLRERAVFKAVEDGYPIPEAVLQDFPDHRDRVIGSIWRSPDGSELLPHFKVGDTTARSKSHQVDPGWNVRAFRRGEWIDALSYTRNRRDGLGKRIHADEWPAKPTDQLALIRGLHHPDEMAADRYFDAMRMAITDVAPVNQTPFDHPDDWWVVRSVFPPAMISRYAPQTAQTNKLLQDGQAVFSLGKENWAKTREEFLSDIRFVELDQSEIDDLKIAAEPFKSFWQGGHNKLFVREPGNRDNWYLFTPHYRHRERDTILETIGGSKDGKLWISDAHSLSPEVRDMFHAGEIIPSRLDVDISLRDTLIAVHKDQLYRALRRGMPVPGDVLVGYPELRNYRTPNLTGDDRPVPEFPDENTATVFRDSEYFEEFENDVIEEIHEGLHQSPDGDELMFQAQKKCLEANHRDYLADMDDLYDLSERQPWYEELREEILQEFDVDADEALAEEAREEFEDRVRDVAYSRLIDEAVERNNPEDDVWSFEGYTPDGGYREEEVHEIYYELESEKTHELVGNLLDDTYLVQSHEQEGADPYFIIRCEPNDVREEIEYRLHEMNSDGNIGAILTIDESYEDATKSARTHAKLGFIPRSYPVNRTAPRTDEWGMGHIHVGDGETDNEYRLVRALGKGDFAVVMSGTRDRPGYQAVHLQTGLPIGPVWLEQKQSMSFVDLLQPRFDWSSVNFDNLGTVSPVAENAASEARRQVREASRTGRRMKRRLSPVKQGQSPFGRDNNGLQSGFSGAIAFSVGLLENALPRFEEMRETDLERDQIDRKWLIDRIRETAHDGPIFENFIDRHYENYIPETQTLARIASATYEDWSERPDSEQHDILEELRASPVVKSETILIDLAPEWEEAIQAAFDREVNEYDSARVIHDDDHLGYRLVYHPDHPDSGFEIYAPGPLGDETFIGHAQGEDFPEALEEAKHIAGRFALMGIRDFDHPSLFEPLNPSFRNEDWVPARLILSHQLETSRRTVKGVARGNFGLVSTDQHLGEKQPGFAVLHLPTGLPVKPFFRTDREARNFAELLDVQADWGELDNGELLSKQFSRLQDIALNSSLAVKDFERSIRSGRKRPTETNPGFSGAVAFKVVSPKRVAEIEKEIIREIKTSDDTKLFRENWRNFLELLACEAQSYAFPKDSQLWTENEKNYLAVVDRYRKTPKGLKTVRENFPRAARLLLEGMQLPENDILGRIHMEFAGDKRWGQYFTPYSVARLNAAMTFGDLDQEKLDQANDGKGFISLSDPTCGAGVMMIAAVDHFRQLGLDPETGLRVHMKDLDARAVHMAFINMALRGIPARVVQGNGLSDEEAKVWVTPAFIRERQKDIAQDRRDIGSNLQAEFPFSEVSLSIGRRDYRRLSEDLVRLGAGDPTFLDHDPVFWNDERTPDGREIPGEASRLSAARQMLEAANVAFMEAETLGLSAPHPDRQNFPVQHLGDDYHQELAEKIHNFLESEDILHPTSRKRAQPLFEAAAAYQNLRESYLERFPEWNVYQDLITPRYKTGETPVFGSEDDFNQIDVLPDASEISRSAAALADIYYHRIRGEYLIEHGERFEITEEFVSEKATHCRAETIASLSSNGDEINERSISKHARELVLKQLRDDGLAIGDIDEAAFDREFGDEIAEATYEKSRNVAEEQLKEITPRVMDDKTGLGYRISKSNKDIVWQVQFNDQFVADADSWNEAVIMAEAHARGENASLLKDPSLPLNLPGPDAGFTKRQNVFYASPGSRNDLFNGIGGKLIDAQVHGQFAISRDRDGRPGWFISHLPTGMSVMTSEGRFSREEEARDCVIELQAAANWDIRRNQIHEWSKTAARDTLRNIAAAVVDKHLSRSSQAAAISRKQAKSPDHSKVHIAEVAFKLAEQDFSDQQERLLIDELSTAVDGGRVFASTSELRKFASDLTKETIRPESLKAKRVEELAEVAMLRLADRLTNEFADTMPVGDRMQSLENLQNRFSRFSKRTSHSSEMQAYSTPVSLAYFANWLLDAKPGLPVTDPAAGHGALFLGTPFEDRRGNELDQERARYLAVPETGKSTRDATRSSNLRRSERKLIPYLIANPPFGVLSGFDQSRVLALEETGAHPITSGTKAVRTNRLEEVIAWNALSNLDDDGRAVLLMPSPRNTRSSENPYLAAGMRSFYWKLYNKFNVTGHVTLDGSLYQRQGAQWPIDVIVIDGIGTSKLDHPGYIRPPVVKSQKQLQEIANHVWKQRTGKLDGSPDFHSAAILYSRHNAPLRNGSAANDEPQAGPGDLSLRTSGEAGRDGERGSGNPRPDHGQSGNPRIADTAERSDRAPGFQGVPATSHTGAAGRPENGDSSRTETTRSGSPTDGDQRMKPAVNDESLTPYKPMSGGKSQNTLMPSNLHSAFEKAKKAFIEKHGDIDEYVQGKLGYTSRDDLYKALSAEQIDTAGMSIDQFESGGSFINGKLMGMGKGRDAAVQIVYAHRHGLIPVFHTEKPNLYPAIMRDLADIGFGHLRPLITNDGLTASKALPLPDGTVLSTPDKAKHDAELIRIRDQKSLGDKYDMVFTTWSQTQTVNGHDTLRRQLLRALAPKAYLVRDETHNAGGNDELYKDLKAPENRAEFARSLGFDAKGVYDSSGTYAKRPSVMDLFCRTDLRLAVKNPTDIGEVISKHGIPMQQMVATMLAESGQYMRLERSMDGTKYDFIPVDIDEKRFDQFAGVIEAIAEFDQAKNGRLKGSLGRNLLKEGKAALPDGAIGEVGVNSTNFTSLLHNVTDQALLAMTADHVAGEAIEALKNGEKPFITLANTMGSFLSEYASVNELQAGDAISASYGDLLKRYVARSRDVTLGTPFGEKIRRPLTDAELGSDLTAKYAEIIKRIDAIDWSGMPVSPIDYVKNRIEKAGYTFGEFTGRTDGIDYSGEIPRYYRRTAQERSKAAAVLTEQGFNDGSIDAALANATAASGMSLHASEKFADQRPRVDLTWQADRDVTTHVQLKWRTNREGQVVPPRYGHFVPNIPAAERPAAVLEAKLQSLNANTTARKNGLLKSGGVNILNPLGDRAAATVMENNPSIHYRFGLPLKPAAGGRGLDPEGAARKITGRLVMLPVKEQRKLYEELEREYRTEYARAEAFGTLKEEARVLDLDARLIARAKLDRSIKSSSPFGGPIFINKMDVANLDRPFPWARIQAMLNDRLGMPEKTSFADLQKHGRDHAGALRERMIERFEKYKSSAIERASAKRKEQVAARLDGHRERFEKLVSQFPVGRTVALKTPDGRLIYGVVSGLSKRGSSNNPVASAAWSVQLYLADGSKSIDLRLNEVALPGEKSLKGLYELAKADQASVMLNGELKSMPVSHAFDNLSADEREERLIATGNILAAADRFDEGQAIYFRNTEGEIEAGLILPRGASIENTLATSPVLLEKQDHQIRFLKDGNTVFSADNNLSIKVISKDKGSVLALSASRGRSTGGRYWLDREIRNLTGDFVSSGSSMVAYLPIEKSRDMLDIIEKKGIKLFARDDLDNARKLTGTDLPEMVDVKSTVKPDNVKPATRPSVEQSGFVMPWDLRGQEQKPFARSLQFSLGRPVALRETENGFEPVQHNGAPGPQQDGSRIHRIMGVPDYVSPDNLIAHLHLEDHSGRHVHQFNRVYFSVGNSGSNGLTVFSEDQINDFPPHHQYDIWAMRRGAPPAQWVVQDVPLLSPEGPVRYPGFTSPDAPGLAVVPFPRPGLRPGSFDPDALRFVVIHRESGQALLPGNRFMYTAEGAAEAARNMAAGYDFTKLTDPEAMPYDQRARINSILQTGYEKARETDLDHWLSYNLAAGVSDAFQNAEILWMPVLDATAPDLDDAVSGNQAMGVFYLYPDRDTALDAGLEDAIPVRVLPGKVADLTVNPWPEEIRSITREFFENNRNALELGLSTTLYEEVDQYQEYEDRVDDGEDPDTVMEEIVERELKEFTYDAFEDYIRRQDYRAAGQYDGDLKDAIMGWLADAGFDSARMWNPFEYDQKELSAFRVRNVEPAWDQLEATIAIAREERAEELSRKHAWSADRGEDEVQRLKSWKAEELESFDPAQLQEHGFDVNEVHWLAVPNREFPELDRAWEGQKPELFTRRTDAEASGRFPEAVPVYLRRGAGVDLTGENEKSLEFIRQLEAVPGIDHQALSKLPGGDASQLIDYIDQLAEIRNLDWVQFNQDNVVRTRLVDTSDVRVAWDAIQRKSLHRRTSDVYVGPALAAAAEAAALEAPRLLLTGPNGEQQSELDAKMTSIFLQAEEVRTLVGKGTIVLFVDRDRLRLFDRDARLAHAHDPALPLVEINDMAEIEMPAADARSLAENLAKAHEVAIACLDDDGKIKLEQFAGSSHVTETFEITDASDSSKLSERQKLRAERKQTAWADKPVQDRYEDLLLAARSREVPALHEGDRYCLAGRIARDMADKSEMLRSRLDANDVTWFEESEIGQITSLLASEGKRLMLADGMTRGQWRQARISDTQETVAVEEILAANAIERHAEMSQRHPDRIVFVRDGESWLTFDQHVEQIAIKDPLLTSKFEQLGDHKAIRLSDTEAEYQARQMSLRGLSVALIEVAEDGRANVRNFDPDTEITRVEDTAQSITGQKREEAVKRQTAASSRIEAETLKAQDGRAADLASVWDSAKSQNPASVVMINTPDGHVLFDGDARLAARFFQPAQSRLTMVRDGQERQRVTTTIAPAVVDRALETLRNQSADIVVLSPDGDEWQAASHAATRMGTEYEPLEEAVLKRRNFETATTWYVPADRAGNPSGHPLLDGISVYSDENAASVETGTAIPVHIRTGNLAKLTAAELAGYSWTSRLKEIHDRLSAQYGFSGVEELKSILLDGNPDRWWSEKMTELGIAGDPRDLHRSIISEMRRYGHDGMIMLDQNGYEKRVLFDQQAIYPKRMIASSRVDNRNTSVASAVAAAPGFGMRPGNAHPAASPDFVPNRGPARFTVTAAPETRQDVKALLDDLAAHLNSSKELSASDRKRIMRENGLLNRPLDGRISRYTEDVIALNFGYALYPASNGNWVYASIRDFVAATGPGGSLYGRWAPELADQIADYAGIYLDHLDANFEHDLARLKDEIADLAEQVNPSVETNFVDRLFADGRIDGETDRQPVLGLYFAETDSMTISTDLSRGNPKLTGGHELYHSIVPLLEPQERRAIARSFGTEERAAEAFAKWLAGEPDAPGLGKLTNFVARMNSLLSGRGFQTWQDAFEKAKSGKVAARAKVLDVSSNLALPEAVALVEAAGLEALAATVRQYGRRLESKTVPAEMVYRLLKLHLDDAQIVQAARAAGYHRVEDAANVSTIPATRSRRISEDLELHRKLTPVDVGTNDASLVRQPWQMSSPKPRTSVANTAAGPAIARGRQSPHVIRYSIGHGAEMNIATGPNEGWPSKENTLRSSFDVAEYLHREDTGDIANTGRQTMSVPEPVFPLPARNDDQPMARGNFDSIPQKAFALYIRRDDINQLKAEGRWPVKQPILYDNTNRVFYISKEHPEFDDLYDRFGHDQARTEWLKDLRSRDQMFLEHANRSVDMQDRIYLHLPLDEVRLARRTGAVYDSSLNQYYVSKNHSNATMLARKFGPENADNLARVRKERSDLSSKSLSRISASHSTADQMARFSLGRDTAEEVGGSLAGDLGRSAALGGAIAGSVELANQAGAKDYLPDPQTIEGVFQRFGPGDWRELTDYSLSGNGSLWDRISEETRREITAFLELQETGIQNVRDVFNASVGYARELGQGTVDTAALLAEPETWASMLHAAKQFSTSVGNDISNALAGTTFNAGPAGASPDSFVLDEAFMRLSSEAGPGIQPTILEHARTAFSALGDKARELAEPLSDAIGAKATVALAALGGVGGLTAVANVAVAGGGAAALYATGNYLSRRRERLSNWTSIAKTAPWMLSAKEFGQIAKRLYKIETLKTGDGVQKSLLDRSSGEIILAERMKAGEKLSSRRLVEAAHTALVEGALQSGFPVPAHVQKSVEETRKRHLEAGYIKPRISSTIVDAASARAQAWSKSVPVLYAQDDTPASFKIYSEQLRKGFSPEQQFGALLRTRQRLGEETDPVRREQLNHGNRLLGQFMIEQKDLAVSRSQKQSPSQQFTRGRSF